MIEAVKAGLTACCLFGAVLLMAICTVMTVAPGIREWWRKFKGRDAVEKAVGIAAATIAILYGGTKPVQNKGADAGIALVEVAVEYDSTNDVTAVKVSFTGHNVTTATPVSVRNDQRENWRELVKIGATVTSDLATNLLAFAVSGNVATNRFWWVGTETPAVIIEAQGITITNFVASSSSVRIDWTCDDPKATVFAVQRRRKKPAGIPYDAEVEYLQSTGTQHIDTGVLVSNNLSIKMDMSFDAQNCWACGGRTAYHNSAYGFWLDNGRNFIAAYGNTDVAFAFDYKRHQIDMLQNSLYIDGVLKRTFTQQTFSSQSHICLFNLFLNASGGISNIGLKGKVYGGKIYNGEAIVRDYTPVRKGTVGYMYDRVSNQLFGNAGTGAFAYGSDTLSYDWETVDTTSANTYTFSGFTIGEDWEWRIMATYTEGDE